MDAIVVDGLEKSYGNVSALDGVGFGVRRGEELMPEWMRWAARFNPVQWAVEASREVVMDGPDWTMAGLYLALLLGATVATSAFATWAFRAYRRTL